MSKEGIFSLYLINKLLEEDIIKINSINNDLEIEKLYLKIGMIVQDISENFKLS